MRGASELTSSRLKPVPMLSIMSPVCDDRSSTRPSSYRTARAARSPTTATSWTPADSLVMVDRPHSSAISTPDGSLTATRPVDASRTVSLVAPSRLTRIELPSDIQYRVWGSGRPSSDT